ncbi:unnamed protein product [Diamesa serratosioi]
MFPAYKNSSIIPENVENLFLSNLSYDKIPIITNSTLIQQISDSSSESDEEIVEIVSKETKIPDKVIESIKNTTFFIDSDRRKEYLKLESLPFRAIPYYNRTFKVYRVKTKKFKRYYKNTKKLSKLTESKSSIEEQKQLDDELRIYLVKNPQDVEKWIEYIEYKENNVTSTSEKAAKIKLEVIEKALFYNPNDNGTIIRLYLETIPHVHSNDKVQELIEALIKSDPHNYVYWNHLIYNKQSSMSYEVSEVIKLYEKAMKTMRKSNDADPQMIKLFKSCCSYLRQCGLNEQFLAMIQLMINLNINSSQELSQIFFSSEAQNTHLEDYEELIIQSSLPMNELWWRMETLRSIFNFLPARAAENIELDPQRYVFNEDICNLVNPLTSRNYKFDLFIVILHLLKYPLPYHHRQNNQDDIFQVQPHEIESGMEFISVFLHRDLNLNISKDFNRTLYSIIKDLNISPNFLNFNVESDTYLELLSQLLIFCFASFNEHQNRIVLVFWIRLQRLMVVMDRLKLLSEEKEMDPDELKKYKKQIKTKVRNIIEKYGCVTEVNMIIEYALIEKELGNEKLYGDILKRGMDAVENMKDNPQDIVNFHQISLCYCEHLMVNQEREASLEVLMNLAKAGDNCLDHFTNQIDGCRAFYEEAEIEEVFIPKSNLLNVIKAKVYFLLLTKSKKQGLEEILIQISLAGVNKHLKEKLCELYVTVFNLKLISVDVTLANNRSYMKLLAEALEEFPKNLLILQTIAASMTFRWYDIKKLLLTTPTTESLFFLTVAAKYRESLQVEAGDDGKIYKQRVYNTIDGIFERKLLKVSSVLSWRLYMRTSFDHDFIKSKRILYNILENFPWHKAIYLEGARFFADEHSQLQDLILEKGLRAHTLAEELEILRSNPTK